MLARTSPERSIGVRYTTVRSGSVVMGLDEFNIAPDNTGGRPEKDEQEEEEVADRPGPGYEVDPLTRENDSEEFFQDLWDEFVSGDEPTSEEIGNMAARASILTITLKLKMAEYGIWEADDLNEIRWGGSKKRSSSSSSGELFSEGSDSDEESSGLASLVNNANK